MTGRRQTSELAKRLRRVTGSATRPANVTAYTIGDAVSDVTTNNHITFSRPMDDGINTGEVVSAIITSDANVATPPDMELWLFHTDIAEVADNAPWTLTDAEILTCIGVVDFPTGNWKAGAIAAAGNALCETLDIGLTFMMARVGDGSDAVIYGQLVMKNAYVPTSGEVFNVSLLIRQD